MSENNFTSRVKQTWTTYDNEIIQGKTIFKNANQKMCYMYLVSYANANKIFPSISSISIAMCSSERTAMRTIQDLEEIGLIEVIRTKGKSNNYILNDYFEVANSTSDNLSPVTELHRTSDNLSPLPVTNCHTKTKTIKLKTKNKISSRESIDNSLKENFPKAPFDQIKDQMLNDETLTVDTDKQYKSMLEYRLKNWKPVTRKRKAIIRKEVVPEWLNKDSEEAAKEFKTIPEEIAKKKAKIEEQLKSLGGKP